MWLKRQLSLLTPEEESEAAINECLLELRSLLREAEKEGLHFAPSAKLARAMLKAVNWL